jgi:Fe2+ or Zn2+ uptake regulation protein
MEEADGCIVAENWEEIKARQTDRTGFVLSDHMLQYIGICPNCRRSAKPNP